MDRLIHVFWHDWAEAPDYVTDIAAKWRNLHPDWTVIQWDHASAPNYMTVNRDLYDEPDLFSPQSNPWQFRTDLFRLEIMYQMGGVWVDADLEPLKSIDPVVAHLDAFAAWEKQDVWVANGFMGFTAGHPFVRAYLEAARPRILANPGWRVNRQTGPHLLTDLYRSRGGLHVLPEKLVYPYSWDDLDGVNRGYGDAITAHHWNNRRSIVGKML